MRSGYMDARAAGGGLTGGATAMEGIADVAEAVLGLPTRRGIPGKVGGLVDVVKSPAYAAGVGLVLYGAQAGKQALVRAQTAKPERGTFRRMFSRLAEIF